MDGLHLFATGGGCSGRDNLLSQKQRGMDGRRLSRRDFSRGLCAGPRRMPQPCSRLCLNATAQAKTARNPGETRITVEGHNLHGGGVWEGATEVPFPEHLPARATRYGKYTVEDIGTAPGRAAAGACDNAAGVELLGGGIGGRIGDNADRPALFRALDLK